MMKKYITSISLTILGPFLTAATSPDSYGLQRSFFRDHQGKLIIPASHIKGKLRMALEELSSFSTSLVTINVLDWFGEPSADNSYDPVSGLLDISDFTFRAPTESARRTRTAINRISLTAAENQLRDVEAPFGSGTEIVCQGTICFFAKNIDEATALTNALRIGFKWLTNLGGEKGVGFGRLHSIKVDKPMEQTLPVLDYSLLTGQDSLHLRIKPVDPIIIGGVKKRRTNYVSSEQIMPGSLIKGALATSLNQAYGITPFHRELSDENAHLYPGLTALVENFEHVRVSHALPTYTSQPRPVKMPISTVQVDGVEWDTALTDENSPLVGSRAPVYFVDWKEPKEYFGSAIPKEIFITRTEIADDSRRSLESRLFTYSFLCPEDDDGKSIEWVCNIDFSRISDGQLRQQVKREFAQAAHAFLDRLGKLNRSVKVEVKNDLAQPAQASEASIRDGLIVITLQTDALMLNPGDVRQLSPADDLRQLYVDYWKALSGDDSLEMVDFFAHQTFKGGYLYHRYLGAVERQTQPDNYRPYYLTGAGSVFKLRSSDEAKAQKHLTKWLASGLDLPTWAQVEYSKTGKALWQTCPFVPENGYGEIVVNLNWHWDKKC